MKFDIWIFCENISRKFQVHSILTKVKGTLSDDQCTFILTSCSIILKIRIFFQAETVVKIKTHFINKFFFLKIVPFVNVTTWKILQRRTDHRCKYIKLRMRIAWWITKATNTPWEYEIILPFPRQHASHWHYTYVASLVSFVEGQF
jgi:hypothetical protein